MTTTAAAFLCKEWSPCPSRQHGSLWRRLLEPPSSQGAEGGGVPVTQSGRRVVSGEATFQREPQQPSRSADHCAAALGRGSIRRRFVCQGPEKLPWGMVCGGKSRAKALTTPGIHPYHVHRMACRSDRNPPPLGAEAVAGLSHRPTPSRRGAHEDLPGRDRAVSARGGRREPCCRDAESFPPATRRHLIPAPLRLGAEPSRAPARVRDRRRLRAGCCRTGV